MKKYKGNEQAKDTSRAKLLTVCAAVIATVMTILVFCTACIGIGMLGSYIQQREFNYKNAGAVFRVTTESYSMGYEDTINRLVATMSTIKQQFEKKDIVIYNGDYGAREAMALFLMNGDEWTGNTCIIKLPDKLDSDEKGKVFLSKETKARYEKETGIAVTVGDTLNVTISMNKIAEVPLVYGGVSKYEDSYVVADSISDSQIGLNYGCLVLSAVHRSDVGLGSVEGEYKKMLTTLQSEYGRENASCNVIDDSHGSAVLVGVILVGCLLLACGGAVATGVIVRRMRISVTGNGMDDIDNLD